MVEETRVSILQFMEDTGTTQKQVADESGLSATVVSQFLSNTYSGDNEKAADTLNKYLRIAKERLNVVSVKHFYLELGNTQTVIGAAAYAHKHCEMALIHQEFPLNISMLRRHIRNFPLTFPCFVVTSGISLDNRLLAP